MPTFLLISEPSFPQPPHFKDADAPKRTSINNGPNFGLKEVVDSLMNQQRGLIHWWMAGLWIWCVTELHVVAIPFLRNLLFGAVQMFASRWRWFVRHGHQSTVVYNLVSTRRHQNSKLYNSNRRKVGKMVMNSIVQPFRHAKQMRKLKLWKDMSPLPSP